MVETELNNLEKAIEDFIKSFQQLTIENNSLRKEISHLHHDRTVALDEKKRIAASLRKIIIQLQDELSCKNR